MPRGAKKARADAASPRGCFASPVASRSPSTSPCASRTAGSSRQRRTEPSRRADVAGARGRRGLLAFHVVDTHRTRIGACSRARAGQLARRAEISLRHASGCHAASSPLAFDRCSTLASAGACFTSSGRKERHGICGRPGRGTAAASRRARLARGRTRRSRRRLRALVPRARAAATGGCVDAGRRGARPRACSPRRRVRAGAGRPRRARRGTVAARRARCGRVAAETLRGAAVASALAITRRTVAQTRRATAAPGIDRAIRIQLRSAPGSRGRGDQQTATRPASGFADAIEDPARARDRDVTARSVAAIGDRGPGDPGDPHGASGSEAVRPGIHTTARSGGNDGAHHRQALR